MSKQVVQVYERDDNDFHRATVIHGSDDSPSKTWKKTSLFYGRANVRPRKEQLEEAKKLQDMRVF